MKLKQLFTLAIAAGISATSMAETAYNELITNDASLTYNVGTGTTQQSVVAAEAVTFLVDRKVIFTLSPEANSVTPAVIGTEQVIQYTLINTSNAPIRFLPEVTDLTGEESAYTGAATATDNTKDTKVTTYQIYYEAVGDGFGIGTSETNITAGLGYVELAQDAQITLYVVTTPTVGEDLDIFVHNLTISAQDHTDTVDDIPTATAGTLIAASTGSWNKDLVQTVLDTDAGGATRTANGAIQVSSATLGMTKTVTVINDGLGLPTSNTNAKAIPGATVQYKLTVSNSGSVEATGVVITDIMPVEFDPATFTYSVATDIADGNGLSETAAAVSISPTTGTTLVFPAQSVPANVGSVNGVGGTDGLMVISITAVIL